MSLAAVRDAISSGSKALSRDWVQVGDERARDHALLHLGPSIDAALPEGGLPRSAVVEVASPLGLARSTSLAARACAAAQRSDVHRESRAWCAWVDPWCSLHAPGVHASGVELERLLVVRPDEEAIARTVVRMASSKAFALIVVDLVAPLGLSRGASPFVVRLDRWANVVRRIALAIEDTATTVLLLTDSMAHRSLPLPVAMRIELERDHDRHTRLRIAKDRHGRLTGFVPVDLVPVDLVPVELVPVELVPGASTGALPPRLASATSLGP